MQDLSERGIGKGKQKKCLINDKQYSLPETWVVRDLGQTSTLKGRIGWQGLTTAEYRTKGDYYLITGTDFKEGKIGWNTCFFVAEKRYLQDKNIQVREEDILITKDGTIGKIAYVDRLPKPATLNSGIFVIRPKNKVYLPSYMYFILSSGIFEDFIENLKAGSTIAHLYQKDFVSFEFPIPDTEEEQKKIAAILLSVGSAIDKTKELIEKHKKMKQGVMQDFFDNADKQGIGNRWLSITLGNPEYFELATGGTPSTAIPEYWGGTIKWMASGEIHKKRIYDVDGRITDKGFENSNATVIPRNSILIALAGQGKTRGTVAINKIELTTNQSVAAVIPRKGKIDPEYLYHYLDNKYLELRSISAGAGRAGLSLSILGKYAIEVHAEPREQERIAQVLDKIDESIRSEESYQNKLLKMKDGLMQDLLTGTVRAAA